MNNSSRSSMSDIHIALSKGIFIPVEIPKEKDKNEQT